MYALLYTTIECVNTLTIQTIYMLNVCIVVHAIECVNTLTIQTIYMLNVSTYFMYALLYTTIECVNTLIILYIYMLNHLICLMCLYNLICMHCCTRQSNV